MTTQDQADAINAELERKDKAQRDMKAVEEAGDRVFADQVAGIEAKAQKAAKANQLSPKKQAALLKNATPVGFVAVNYQVEPATMNRITDPDIINRAIATAERAGSLEWASAWRTRLMQVGIDGQNAAAQASYDESTVNAMNQAKAAADAQMNAAVTAANQPPKTDAEWEAEGARLAAQTEKMMRGQ